MLSAAKYGVIMAQLSTFERLRELMLQEGALEQWQIPGPFLNFFCAEIEELRKCAQREYNINYDQCNRYCDCVRQGEY